MRTVLSRLAERLDSSLWLIPTLCLVAATGLSAAAEAIDRQLSAGRQAWYLFQGGPDGARVLLSAIASSMMTFTGVVFSVTVLVLQLASNQFSPRVMRTFLRDRPTQLVLGIYVGTFFYALLGLRSVRSELDDARAYVPALTVGLALVLAATCVACFVYFLHHVAQSIRVVNVLGRIGDEGRRQIRILYPEEHGVSEVEDAQGAPAGEPSCRLSIPDRFGILASVDEDALWRQATAAGVCLRLIPMVGDFVPEGSVVFEVWGDAKRLDTVAVLEAINVDRERSIRQDLGFAVRQLVDVAERALSPGINDPTTAVQAIDQLHDLLRRLVRRRFPSPVRRSEAGDVRLVLPRSDWDAYLALALDEVREAGAGQMQVVRRLRFLLADLNTIAPPARQASLSRQLELLDAGVQRAFPEAADRATARSASPQGHGGR